jgi:rhomboid protease GluP
MSHSENSAPSPQRIRQTAAPQNEVLSEEEKADLVCLAHFSSGKSAHQAGTVLLTQGYWYVIFQEQDNRWGLYVQSAIAKEAARLVEKNLNETRPLPENPAPQDHPHRIAPWHLIPAPLLLMIVFLISATEPGRSIVETGRFDSIRILSDGEWWRLVSPLFLHADTAHLLGNIFGGLAFGGLLASRIGITQTYAVALISGIAGNGLNLLTFRNTPHLSIGASTAVFGLLGALVGLRLSELMRDDAAIRSDPAARRHALRIRFGIFGIGLVLLGWLGTGGVRTDVPAHLYGFASGLILLFLSASICENLRMKSS